MAQSIFPREEEGHQRNLGIEFGDFQHRAEATRSRLRLTFRWEWLRFLGFHLFNIQVRAKCTTACNIQAALRNVELTHVSSSISLSLFFFLFCLVFFFKFCICFCFTKMRMQLRTGSEVMLAPPPFVGRVHRGQTEDERWWVSRRMGLIGSFHIHRDARGKTVSTLCPFVPFYGLVYLVFFKKLTFLL